MNGKLYLFVMQTEIGLRKGKLFLKYMNQKVIDWIDFLSTRDEIHGEWLNDSLCIFQGNIYSIQQMIPFQATCSLCQNEIKLMFQIQNKKIYASGKGRNNG